MTDDKAGSMSMTDVAKQIGTMGASATSFGGDQAANQRKLLALGQLAAPQGSVEEAGTFVKDLVSEAGGHRKKLEKMGVHFGKGGLMESPEQMIGAVLKGTGGDITKIEDVFGKRGTQVFRPLQQAYLGAGGGENGVAAANKVMGSVSGATMTAGDLDKQVEQILNQPAAKFERILNEITEKLETGLEPAFEKFADKLPDILPAISSAIEAVGSFATFMANNPLAGIGAVIAAKVGQDVAAAQIGEVIKRLLGGGGGGGGGIGGGAGALGKIGAGIAIAGAAIATTEAGMELIDSHNAGTRKAEGATVLGIAQSTSDAAAAQDKAYHRNVTPADLGKMHNEAERLKGEREREEKNSPLGGGKIAQFIAPGVAADVNADHNAKIKALNEAIGAWEKAIKTSKAAIDAHTKSVGAMPNPARNGPMPSRADPRHP